MRKEMKIVAIFLTIAALTLAQSQIATVTSTVPFHLRGAGVTPGQGVPSWPAMPGDTIKADNGPVTITYLDGSTFILDPGSTAKVNSSGQMPVFQLESGLAHFSIKSLTAVKLMALDQTVEPKTLEGIIKISNGKVIVGAPLAVGVPLAVAGWWTAGHVALVVVGASAAAVGGGIGIANATSGGEPSSVGGGGN